eukprot:CAMPEP_0171190736 /NCGR_PEP_ID=MMETSP0790-20130122/19006_1 /TAXON_ID=2925 /ORGANISM="Alexandrium catenella, Strain OF101" /LENGTH=124 /DNA_ID=CAMNT_0011655869 /DNA_START=285 /DNA_END=656 /DNA_ORIENTATION=+
MRRAGPRHQVLAPACLEPRPTPRPRLALARRLVSAARRALDGSHGRSVISASPLAGPPLARLLRSAAQKHLEDLGVGPELVAVRLVGQSDNNGVGRERAEERRLQHEGVALLVDADVVERVVLA